MLTTLMDSTLRLRSSIVDLVGGDGIKRSRELYIDITNTRGDCLGRLKMYGYQYVLKSTLGIQTLFTFSPGHQPYSHTAWTRFVEDVRTRRDSKFYFDSTSQFSAGFVYRGGIFRVETVHGTTSFTITIPYTDFLVDDLIAIGEYLTKYIESSADSQLQDLIRGLNGLNGRV